ncbi:MAG: ATP-binding protein [Chlorobi bacterium]|nr:ATP-binding protein [Chlorobiota bacterium]
MQAFYQTHKYRLENLSTPVRRELFNAIDWSKRLIGIKGARGVGKTTFLLDYAKQTYGLDKSCLYINMNNLYFTSRSIISFADEFRKTGGKTLIIDQIYKYPEWSKELKYCYDNFKDLQIIFSGSSVMPLDKDNPDLEGRVSAYTLEGFSFREYLNLKTGLSFQSISIDEIIKSHTEISKEIVNKVKPLAYYNDYLHHGYYPFFLEKHNYFENLLKTINFILEIDISYLQQVELKYLPKLRKLLYLVAKSAPFQPNISKLSNEVETSRATIMNYLNYLQQAQLINMLFEKGDNQGRKPAHIYMQNPNLVYSVYNGEIDQKILNKTFFYNQTAYNNKIEYSKTGDFLINNEYTFIIDKNEYKNINNDKTYITERMTEVGSKKTIPLWLFGFLH